jgi:3-oxoacyl-[acyl-carrier protein] reductase
MLATFFLMRGLLSLTKTYTMLLQNKNAIIYGGGGSLGGAVARALAREGARVFVTGRGEASIEKVANDINQFGGRAETAMVDAMDQQSIEKQLQAMVQKAGSVDISFNAIGWEDKQGVMMTDMSLDDFIRPIHIAMQTQFLTGTAAGRVMMQQGSGVILSLTATPAGIGYPRSCGFGVACCAVENLSKSLAIDLGKYGVRVVNIRSAGSPDSKPFAELMHANPETGKKFLEELAGDTMLKKMPMMNDIADAAVFLASNRASKITGITLDVTCGTTGALNYKDGVIPFVHYQ